MKRGSAGKQGKAVIKYTVTASFIFTCIFNISSKIQQQQQPSLLVPSKLGYARDKTHKSQKKIETKEGGKRRAIKKQTEKGKKAIKH
jgi:hypothetical protein